MPQLLRHADCDADALHGDLRTHVVDHLRDSRGRPLMVLLSRSDIRDDTMLALLLAGLTVAQPGPGRPRTRRDHLLPDKGYSLRNGIERAARSYARSSGRLHMPCDIQIGRVIDFRNTGWCSFWWLIESP